MNGIITTGFIIGMLAMLFFTPAQYMKGIMQMSYGKLTVKDKVVCYIPIYNVVKAESLYTGKFSIVLIAILSVMAFTSLRLVVVFTLPAVTFIQYISVIVFLLSLVFYYGANVYAVFIVVHDAAIKGCMFRSILFPLGQYYIGNHMNVVVKNTIREERTF